MTPAQLKALVALNFLHRASKHVGFARLDIARVSRQDGGSYPVSTMRALQSLGMVEPLEESAVGFVESGRCRCGCDRWKITDAGRAEAERRGIRNAPAQVHVWSKS